MHTQAYMLRLGTFGFRDMKELISALNRYASALFINVHREHRATSLPQGTIKLPT